MKWNAVQSCCVTDLVPIPLTYCIANGWCARLLCRLIVAWSKPREDGACLGCFSDGPHNPNPLCVSSSVADETGSCKNITESLSRWPRDTPTPSSFLTCCNPSSGVYSPFSLPGSSSSQQLPASEFYIILSYLLCIVCTSCCQANQDQIDEPPPPRVRGGRF